GFTRIGLFSITYILTGSLDLFRGSISLSPVKSGYNWVSGETFGHGNSALVETLETLRSGQLLSGKSFTAISPACHPDVFFPV
ncbi:hypothetical protein QOU41_30100, partial [Pseudomonas aeruginosa]